MNLVANNGRPNAAVDHQQHREPRQHGEEEVCIFAKKSNLDRGCSFYSKLKNGSIYFIKVCFWVKIWTFLCPNILFIAF